MNSRGLTYCTFNVNMKSITAVNVEICKLVLINAMTSTTETEGIVLT